MDVNDSNPLGGDIAFRDGWELNEQTFQQNSGYDQEKGEEKYR
jgi:hypothetical protein